jgi:hypothetical protein
MLVVVAIKPFISVGMFKMFDAAWPGHGPVGPPISSVLISFVTAIYYTVFAKKQLGVSYKVIWPWSAYFKILGAAVVAGLIAAAVLFIPTHYYAAALVGRLAALAKKPSVLAAMQVALGGMVFLPVYVLLLHVWRAVKPKDWELLKDMTYGRFLGRKAKAPLPQEAAAE